MLRWSWYFKLKLQNYLSAIVFIPETNKNQGPKLWTDRNIFLENSLKKQILLFKTEGWSKLN